MKGTALGIILALAVCAGTYYYAVRTPASDTLNTGAQHSNTPAPTSTATNYDECIAEGNVTLKDAPDKCLTTNGHIFIQGVAE